tara:strand:- start:884 stop:2668 length:1785 start_codon:yes stop_codon:yes gene_type:complete
MSDDVSPASTVTGQLEIERANWYFSKLAMIYLGNGISALALTIMLYLWQASPLVLAWGAVALGHITLCRSYTWWPSRNPVVSLPGARFWARYLLFSSLLQGLVWGTVPVLFLTLESSFLLAMIMLFVVANVAGGVVLLSSHPWAFTAYALPAALPLAAVFASEGSPAFLWLAVGLVLFPLVCIALSWDTYRTISSVIRLRIEREGLMEQLNHQVAVAEDAVRDKARFMAAASHDLRQPLAALNLLLAQLDGQLDGSGRMLLRSCEQTTRRMNGLVHSLMDISRLDIEPARSSQHGLPLQSVLDALWSEFSPVARENGVRLIIRDSHAWVHTDPVHLQRILANLLSNAIKHSRGDTVLLAVRSCHGDKKQWRLEVRDNGVGIPDALQGHIFREFFQVENPHRDPDVGAGLGLAIVRRLSNALNLNMTLRSLPGKGSCFSVTVPAGQPDSSKADDDKSLNGPLRDAQVWVVEDDPAVAEALVPLLEQWCCRVSIFRDGETALRACSNADFAPDLLLTDYRLPGDRNGLELVATLRDAWPDLPALLVTGESLDRESVRRANVGFLRKPVAAPQLRLMLTRQLSASPAQSNNPDSLAE